MKPSLWKKLFLQNYPVVSKVTMIDETILKTIHFSWQDILYFKTNLFNKESLLGIQSP